MQRGDEVRVAVGEDVHVGVVVRIIDRRGVVVPHISEEAPPPFTTVVVEPVDCPGQRICVPLWLPEGEVRLMGCRAA